MKQTLVTGGPGTGKTYSLVQEILKIKPDKFAFLAFTRRAASEAKQRLRSYYKDAELDYCRTIHSLAFKLLNLKMNQVIQWNHIKQFASRYGYELTPRYFSLEDDSRFNLTEDDIEFRTMLISDSQMLHQNTQMWNRYSDFKTKNQLVDYNDMLTKCVYDHSWGGVWPKLDLLLVDELQDLTPLQIGFVGHLRNHCKQVIFAGDANQMIFEWAGVDREVYLNIEKECERKELLYNYRLPLGVNILADRLLSNKRTYTPGQDVYYLSSLPMFRNGESYLVLVRNGYLLRGIVEELNDMGIKWNLLQDEDMSNWVKLSTIHGAKGAEADNVILITDVSPATMESADTEREKRVWYVGLTRTRKRLYIMEPGTANYYDLS